MEQNALLQAAMSSLFTMPIPSPYMEPGSCFVLPSGYRVAVLGCSSDLLPLSSL